MGTRGGIFTKEILWRITNLTEWVRFVGWFLYSVWLEPATHVTEAAGGTEACKAREHALCRLHCMLIGWSPVDKNVPLIEWNITSIAGRSREFTSASTGGSHIDMYYAHGRPHKHWDVWLYQQMTCKKYTVMITISFWGLHNPHRLQIYRCTDVQTNELSLVYSFTFNTIPYSTIVGGVGICMLNVWRALGHSPRIAHYNTIVRSSVHDVFACGQRTLLKNVSIQRDHYNNNCHYYYNYGTTNCRMANLFF